MDSLIRICEQAFPRSLRWQAVSTLSKRWWHLTLLSTAAEVWIIPAEGTPAGLLVLVTDEKAWARKRHLREGGLMWRLRGCMSCPLLLLRRGCSKLVYALCHLSRYASEHAPEQPAFEDRLWVELIAVVPPRQGQGFGRQMLAFCEQRAKALGRTQIMLSVESDNQQALRVYSKSGFRAVQRFRGRSVYGKSTRA